MTEGGRGLMQRMLDDRYPRMPWDEIDNVVFDIGNVLVRFSMEEVARAVCPDDPALRAEMARRALRSPYWTAMDRGAMDAAEAARAMAGGSGALEKLILRLLAVYNEFKRPVEEGVRALTLCKARGKRLYLLSNYHADSYARVCERFPFFRSFDGGVISAHEGLLKPEPAIFQLLIARYALAPGRTLFIDDTAANIEAALHIGLQALWFARPGQLDVFFGA